MVHAPLLVECRDWLSTSDFSAAGGHRAIGNVPIDGPERRFDHFTAEVCLGDDAVSVKPVIQLDSSLCPLSRLVTPRCVGQHPARAVRIDTDRHDAAFVRLVTPSAAGID